MKVLLVLAPGYLRLPLPGVEGIRRTYPQSFSIPLSPLAIWFLTHYILLLLKCYGRHTQSRKRLKVSVVNSDLERSRSWLLFRPRRSLDAQGASNCTSQSFLALFGVVQDEGEVMDKWTSMPASERGKQYLARFKAQPNSRETMATRWLNKKWFVNGLFLSIRDRVNLFHPDWSKWGRKRRAYKQKTVQSPYRMNKGRRRRSMFQISRRTCSEWPKTSCKMRQRKAMTGALSVRPVETAWPTASITQIIRHSRPHTRRKRIKAPEVASVFGWPSAKVWFFLVHSVIKDILCKPISPVSIKT